MTGSIDIFAINGTGSDSQQVSDCSAATAIEQFCSYRHRRVLRLVLSNSSAVNAIGQFCSYCYRTVLQLLLSDSSAATAIEQFCNYRYRTVLHLLLSKAYRRDVGPDPGYGNKAAVRNLNPHPP